jgi:hypothetical protein
LASLCSKAKEITKRYYLKAVGSGAHRSGGKQRRREVEDKPHYKKEDQVWVQLTDDLRLRGTVAADLGHGYYKVSIGGSGLWPVTEAELSPREEEDVVHHDLQLAEVIEGKLAELRPLVESYRAGDPVRVAVETQLDVAQARVRERIDQLRADLERKER